MSEPSIMDHALNLARRGWGTTHPNPMVGAVITQGDEILAEGWHEKAGGQHAEIMALEKLKGWDLTNATLYVTLEPCSTTGRTPPCTESILTSGIRHVVVGALDPNPKHTGKGIDLLKNAGITVERAHWTIEDECKDLNLIFNHWITRQTPFLAGKIATTLDAKLATRTGHSKWITGNEARQDAHRWRRYFPAIAVGARTVLTDNPRLTARLETQEEWCPIRFVFDRRLQTLIEPLPLVLKDVYAGSTILVTSGKAQHPQLDAVAANLADVWTLPTETDEPFFKSFREHCIRSGITGVYVEGGAGLHSALLRTQQLDYLFAYRAPKIIGDSQALGVFDGLNPDIMDEAIELQDVRHEVFGEDQLMRGFIS